MPSRPDIRDLATNVRTAFAEHDRDALLDVLTFVVKEYVVEGPPPMMIHQAETLGDLAGATFAQLITAMQTRFDHAELAMFVVDGEQVSVRIGGVMQPLLASRQPLATPAAELPRPQAGVRVVETTLQQRPVQAAPAAPPTAAAAGGAPPPRAGLSLRGRPSGDGGPVVQPTAPPAGAASPAPVPAAPSSGGAPTAAPAPSSGSAPSSDKEHTGDDASARFSLLELD